MSIVHIAFYPSDWLAGTRGLSAEESGVYITLICRMYEMAGPIERDDKRLSRLCGCKSVAAFRNALSYLMAEGKIIEVDGGLFNERAQKEIEKVINKSDKAREAANSRWERKPNKNNGSTNANASPKHMQTPCQSEPEPEEGYTNVYPLGEFHENKPKKRRASKRPLPEGFSPDVDKARSLMDELDLTRQEMNYCWQRMKEHAYATDRRQVDWDRSFNSWVRKSVNDGEIGPGSRSRKAQGATSTAFDF